jgi:acetolactate synthase-1/2/3 large subunit
MAKTEKLLTEATSAGEGMAKVLEQAGIDMVFGIQGGNMGRFYDALYDHQDTVRCVLVRHEQLASVMAEVYGRLTGKPGVCVGQGIFMLANGFLGTLEAHFGSSPMLFLTDFSDVAPFAQHAPYQSGRGEYGGADTRQALSAVTKHTLTALTPTEAVHAVQLGIKHALSGERGPVGIVFNSNCFSGGTIDPDARPVLYDTAAYLPAALPGDPASVAAAARALAAAERPVIIAGNGVRISQAYDQLAALAALIGAPVATTASGKGVIAETHDWALGTCGNFGQSTANTYVGGADLVLAVGTRLGPADTVNENPAFIDPGRQTIVQIDIEPKNASWSFPSDTVVIGDAAKVLGQIADAVKAAGAPAADAVAARKQALDETRAAEDFFSHPAYTSDDIPIMPPRVFREMHNIIDDDALMTCDAGENRLFMTHFFQTKGAGTLLMPGIGAMGYAVPAALAGKLVHPDRQVIAVTGDGGFSMAINGIMTARDENIPIVVVILNNSALGWVKHGQGNRTINSTFSDMNFANIAESMGVKGLRVEKPADLPAALTEALGAGVPTVVDVVTAFDGLSFRDVTSPLTQG